MRAVSEYLSEDLGINRKKVPLITKLLIGFYFILCFFEPYLNGAIGSVSKYFIFALMGIVMLTAKFFKLQYYHATMLIWFTYKVISVVWADNTAIFELHIVSQIGMTALFICLTMIKVDRELLDIIIKAIWSGSAAIGVLSLFLSKPYHGAAENRLVLNLFGTEADPNNQAALVVLGLAVSFYYIFWCRKYRLFAAAVALINFYSIMLTGSRGGLVTVIMLVAIVFFSNIRRIFTKRGLLLMLTLGILTVGGAFVVTRWLPSDIYTRLFVFETYGGGSERSAIWANTWELITQKANFIFGAGWGSYFGYNGFTDSVHNTFLSMLCDVGIIFTALFLFPVFEKTFYCWRKKEIIPVLLVIAGFVPSFFLEAINKRFFWNAIFFVFMFANYLRDGGRFTPPVHKK